MSNLSNIELKLVDDFITACQYMNYGSDKELRIGKIKFIVTHCDYEKGNIYDIRVHKGRTNTCNVSDISINNLESEIKRILTMNF